MTISIGGENKDTAAKTGGTIGVQPRNLPLSHPQKGAEDFIFSIAHFTFLTNLRAMKTLVVILSFASLFIHSISYGQDFHVLDSIYGLAQSQRAPAAQLDSLLIAMEQCEKTTFEEGITFYHRGLYYGDRQHDLVTAKLYYEKANAIFTSPDQAPNRLKKRPLDCRKALEIIRLREGDGATVLSQSENLALDFATVKDTLGLASVLNLRFAAFMHMGKTEEASHSLSQAIFLSQAAGDSGLVVTLSQNLARAYFSLGKIKAGLNQLLSSQEYWNHSTHDNIKAMHFSILGRLYISAGNPDAAKSAFDQCLYYAGEEGNIYPKLEAYYGLGLWSEAAFDTLKAFHYYRKSLTLASDLGVPTYIANNQLNIGGIYLHQGDYENAQKYLEEANEFYVTSGEVRGSARSQIYLGLIAKAKGNVNQAISHFKKAEEFANILEDWVLIESACLELSKAYELAGEYEAALQAHQRMAETRDSLNLIQAQIYAESLACANPAPTPPASSSSPTIPSYILLSAIGILLLLVVIVLIFNRKRGKTASQQPTIRTIPSTDAPAPTQASPVEIIQTLKQQKDWPTFLWHFNSAYPGLLTLIGKSHPNLTSNDLRILALSKLGLSTGEMADLLHIAPDSAKKARQRTRKKLNLDAKVSLEQFVLGFEVSI